MPYRMLRSCMQIGAIVCALAAPRGAYACTVCDSPASHAVRKGLFHAGFLHTLALVALPCPVLVLAAAAVHFSVRDLKA